MNYKDLVCNNVPFVPFALSHSSTNFDSDEGEDKVLDHTTKVFLDQNYAPYLNKVVGDCRVDHMF
jgi:hypothetical protein